MHLNFQDILAIVAAILGPMGAIIGFMWHHFNSKFEKVDEKIDNLKVEISSVERRLDEKISSVEKRLDEKISNVEKRLDEKISSVEKKLGEEISNAEKRLGEKMDAVRDKVSRIEGQLAPASIVSFNPPKNKIS